MSVDTAEVAEGFLPEEVHEEITRIIEVAATDAALRWNDIVGCREACSSDHPSGFVAPDSRDTRWFPVVQVEDIDEGEDAIGSDQLEAEAQASDASDSNSAGRSAECIPYLESFRCDAEAAVEAEGQVEAEDAGSERVIRDWPEPLPSTNASDSNDAGDLSLASAAGQSFADVDDSDLCCRICRQGEEFGKLFCPCRCKGSIKWVHEDCLWAWLRTQGRSPSCELCGYLFEVLPVYAPNTPRSLTLRDWLDALWSSGKVVACRSLRVVYVVMLWVVALPLLTVLTMQLIFTGTTWLSMTIASVTGNIIFGELLSLAGMVIIYFCNVVRDFFNNIETHEHTLVEGRAPEGAGGTHLATDRASDNQAWVEEELLLEDEDGWSILGMRGSPLAALLCMVSFLFANILGITLLLAIPYFPGRLVVRWCTPLLSILQFSFEKGVQSEEIPALPPPGKNVLVDLCALAAGYSFLYMILLVAAMLVLLLRPRYHGNSNRALFIRVIAELIVAQAWVAALCVWSRLKTLFAVLVLVALVPCFLGHLAFCLLSWPMLHVSQEQRVEAMHKHTVVMLLMELCVGYVYLWGVVYLEGSVMDVASAALKRRLSSNFFLSILCAHRQLFTGSVLGGTLLPTAPRITLLKVSLVLCMVHTVLIFIFWCIPAQMLHMVLGNAFFPIQLLVQIQVKSASVTRQQPHSPAAQGRMALPADVLQWYVLMQCLRLLETSPTLSKVVRHTIRLAFSKCGLSQFLKEPFQVSATSDASQASLTPMQVFSFFAILTLLVWYALGLIFALPLVVGRLVVRQAFPRMRVSDFIPLSVGMIVLSAIFLGAAKLCEALPAIRARVSTIPRGKLAHMMACMLSALAMSLIAFVLLPLGFGTLIFRLLFPLKASSVFQTPVFFLAIDCWGLGLVVMKVIFRLSQTDILLHGFHQEVTTVWIQVQGSSVNLFFDLNVHQRAWCNLLRPLIDVVVAGLVLPYAVTQTLCLCFPLSPYLKAITLMYGYHFVVALWLPWIGVPILYRWIMQFRQKIFDDKYLVSTELQNYHTQDSPDREVSGGAPQHCDLRNSSQ